MTQAPERSARRQRRPARPVDALALLGIFAAGIVAALGIGTFAARPAAAGAELLPDLAMAPLSDFQIQTVNGRRLLRFTAMMVNVGSGHFELQGSRTSTSQPMTMTQVLYDAAGNIQRQIPTSAHASYAGDGHNHWHVDEMMRYDMWGPGGTFRGAKVGFCFLDSDPWNTSLPGHRGSYYRGSMCQTTPAALNNRMGISIGWGDEYEWYLAWQWVDITGVEPGTYTVRAKVDPHGFFTESNDVNQCTWTRVRFGASDSSGVAVEASGSECVTDADGHQFATDIAWAYASGVTAGCAPDLFCPNSAVTREQIASFLTRAFGLAPSGTDFFWDDASSGHQADINSVAAAGVATGCGGGRYCPDWTVNREQMASFLVRALRLGPAAGDYFSDDEASAHEADINSLAEAGVTSGCGLGRYCPTQPVTRGEMVAFLHRAVGQ